MRLRAQAVGCVLVGGLLGVLLVVAVAYVAAVPLPVVTGLTTAVRDAWWTASAPEPGVPFGGP